MHLGPDGSCRALAFGRSVPRALSLRGGLPFLLAGALAISATPLAGAQAPVYQTQVLPGFPTALEVVSDGALVLGYRTRTSAGEPGLPAGDAVLIDEEWWSPLRPMTPLPAPAIGASTMELVRSVVAPARTRKHRDRLTAFSAGDVTLDGEVDLILSFRRPFKRTPINITRPRSAWTDAEGLSSHVGIFRPADLSQVWVAGTLVRPVVEVAACDGALAVAYGRYDQPGTVATDAWRWIEFGFFPVDPLPGPGTPTCVDIDGDGRSEPAIIERSES